MCLSEILQVFDWETFLNISFQRFLEIHCSFQCQLNLQRQRCDKTEWNVSGLWHPEPQEGRRDLLRSLLQIPTQSKCSYSRLPKAVSRRVLNTSILLWASSQKFTTPTRIFFPCIQLEFGIFPPVTPGPVAAYPVQLQQGLHPSSATVGHRNIFSGPSPLQAGPALLSQALLTHPVLHPHHPDNPALHSRLSVSSLDQPQTHTKCPRTPT